ncbi:hypothetical protein WG907_05085 [Sphingobium sp. AN558]|uniref:hypothetical protein n=1 Tax=Sphingobium sp. AN558 TaxID=3133442 RepID=UPI0030C432AA
MARTHPLNIIERREAELNALSRQRGLSPSDVDELERLLARKQRYLRRLPQQISAAQDKLARLQSLQQIAQVPA